MNRSKILAAALIVAALTVPSAVATFYGRGDYEPNTRWDATEGRMFTDPDWTPASATLSGERVYFNGYAESAFTGVNPNVGPSYGGVVGNTRIAAYASNIPHVLMGLWKDCNKDGYIGLADSAVIEYNPALLGLPNSNGVTPGTGVCPTQASPDGEMPVHNDGEWVREFISIGMVDPCRFKDTVYRRANCGNIGAFAKNWDVLYVNNTRVWVDDTRPGIGTGSGACPFGVPDRGTTASTGGLINYGDCFVGRRVANTINANLGPYDGTAGQRFSFEDPRRPAASSSTFNREIPLHPWNNPYTNSTGSLESDDPTDSRYPYDPAFTASDCSKPRTTLLRDPTAGPTGNGTLNQVGVKAPQGTPAALMTQQHYLVASVNGSDRDGVILAYYGFDPKVGNPQGSYWAGVEDAYDAVYIGNSDYQAKKAGDCDRRTNNTYHDYASNNFNLEGDNSVGSSSNKFENYDALTFLDSPQGYVDGGETDSSLGIRDWPTFLGINARELWTGPDWYAGGTAAYVQGVNRNTLEPHPAFFRTYYAYLDPAFVTKLGAVLPSTTDAKYGSDACPSIGAGAPPANGWVCDPAKWYKSADTDTMPYFSDQLNKIPRGAKVGEAYTFRDVDCWDGHVGGVESEGVVIYASGVQYNPNDPRVCTQF